MKPLTYKKDEYIIKTETGKRWEKKFQWYSSKLEGKYEGNKMDLGYVWFLENLRENTRETKYKGKVERKKKSRKIKNKLKVDNFFFLLLQTHFIYFNSSI